MTVTRLAAHSPPKAALLRQDFPILQRQVHGQTLAYLDSAATSLKPQAVIDAVVRFYSEYTANVHRAVHALSEEATEAYENARAVVARFIHADARELAFVRNTTEALNVVAATLRDGGLVVMPLSEHHSNLLPWRSGRALVIETHPSGEVDLEHAQRLFSEHRPALLAVSTISSALGIRVPVAALAEMARRVGAAVLLDISQSVGHEPLDIRALDCDYACFSGHKMLGPSGIGVLYQREGVRDPVRPILVGGSMVQEVHRDNYVPRPFPWCIEAGTPNIEGAIALAAACEYLEGVGLDVIQHHTRTLTAAARRGLAALEGVKLHGTPQSWSDSIVSFSVEAVEAHAVARILSNRFGIMVRSGFHCAQPLHEACGLAESVRASVHVYNSMEEIERFLEAMGTLVRFA